MFFLFSWIWSIVVFDAGPLPAVGEAVTEKLAKQYIGIVRNHAGIIWTRHTGLEIGIHTVTGTADVGVGTVYRTSSKEDGQIWITLLVGEYSKNVAEGLTYFRKLYDEKFSSARHQPKQKNSFQKRVVLSALDPNRPLLQLDPAKKSALRKTVSVTQESIQQAIKNAQSTTVVVHFVNESLKQGSGQEPAVRDMYAKDAVTQAYANILSDRTQQTLSPSETAIVHIAPEQNISQECQYASYVLANPAPEGCHDDGKWSKNVDSVIRAIGEVLQHETGFVTVFVGAHGCGIYGNDPKRVAKVYYSRLYEWLFELSDEDRNRLKIIFPIPIFLKNGKSTDNNFEDFQKVLGLAQK